MGSFMFTFTKSNTRRLNLSLPPDLYADILFISGRMGISASALVYQITSDSLHHMANILRQARPDEPVGTTVKRLRGDSLAYIKSQYESAMQEVSGGRRHDDAK